MLQYTLYVSSWLQLALGDLIEQVKKTAPKRIRVSFPMYIPSCFFFCMGQREGILNSFPYMYHQLLLDKLSHNLMYDTEHSMALFMHLYS